jgi:hypothetical protein
MFLFIKRILFLSQLLMITACGTDEELEASASDKDRVAQIEKKSVEAARTAANNHAWVSKFSYQLGVDALTISLRVATSTIEQVRPLRIKEAKKRWLHKIDEKWNNRFGLVLSNETIYPIRFEVKFSPIKSDHHVVIHQGKSANQHNWSIDMPSEAAAHEIGHMLGAFDEYKKGALSLQKPLVDGNSIMGRHIDSGYPYPRHLALVLQNIRNELNDDARIVLM